MSDVEERERLALRVSPDTKEKFEQKIKSNHGFIRPYAGVQVEREIFAEVGKNPLSDTMSVLEHLLNDEESLRNSGMLHVNTRPNKIVNYRVHPDAREEVFELQKRYDARSAGNVLEAIMFRYQSEGSIQQRIQRKAKQLQLIVEGGDQELLDSDHDSTPIAQHLQQEAAEVQAIKLKGVSEQLEQVANAIQNG